MKNFVLLTYVSALKTTDSSVGSLKRSQSMAVPVSSPLVKTRSKESPPSKSGDLAILGEVVDVCGERESVCVCVFFFVFFFFFVTK